MPPLDKLDNWGYTHSMETKTRHNADCRRAFKNYDLECPRCKELAAGQAPRAGWGDWKREQEARQIRWIRAHNCKAANCNPIVCTFGDW
jgi:hypothetical protein